jgi:hypothetical protein
MTSILRYINKYVYCVCLTVAITVGITKLIDYNPKSVKLVIYGSNESMIIGSGLYDKPIVVARFYDHSFSMQHCLDYLPTWSALHYAQCIYDE